MMFNMWKEQFARARNGSESFPTRCRRYLWAMLLWWKAVLIGLKFCRRPQLGSRVIYDGDRWQITNGVVPSCWTLHRLLDNERREYVPRSECRSVLTPSELWHRFIYGYDWWGGYWHNIAVEKRVYRRNRP